MKKSHVLLIIMLMVCNALRAQAQMSDAFTDSLYAKLLKEEPTSSKWSTNPFLDLKDEDKRPDWIAKNTHDSTLFVSTAQFLEQDSLGRMVFGEKKGESAWRVRVLNGTKHVLFAYNPEEPLEAAMIPVSTIPADSDAAVAQATEDTSNSSTSTKLTLREMLKMSLDNQANKMDLAGMCWFTLNKIDSVLDPGVKNLRHYTMLDSARYHDVANPGKDTALYNRLVLYAENCNHDPMYFGVMDTTGVVTYVYQNHLEKSKDGSGPKDGTAGESAPVADNTGGKSSDGGAAPKGSTATKDTTKAGASADSSATASNGKSKDKDKGNTKSAAADTTKQDEFITQKVRKDEIAGIRRADGTIDVLHDEFRYDRMLANRDYPLNDYLGGGTDRVRYGGGWGRYSNYGLDYSSSWGPSYGNYGLMAGGCCQNVYQQNYWVPRGHWSGYNNQMYPNYTCEGPLWMSWAHQGCVHSMNMCGQQPVAYNDYSGWNISAGAGVTIGGSIGGGYRNAAADGSSTTTTPMVIRIDTEGMKQEVAAAAKKAETDAKNLASAKAKADMQAEVRTAIIKQQVADKVRMEALATQQQMRDEVRAEVANIERVRQEAIAREEIRNEVTAALNNEASRVSASKEVPVAMNSVRPAPVTTKPVTNVAPVSSGLQNVRPVQAQAKPQVRGKGDRVQGDVFTASNKGDRGNHTSSMFETPRVNNTTRPTQQMHGAQPNGDIYRPRPQAVQQQQMTRPETVQQRPVVAQQPTMTMRPQVQQRPTVQPSKASPRVQMTRMTPRGKR